MLSYEWNDAHVFLPALTNCLKKCACEFFSAFWEPVVCKDCVIYHCLVDADLGIKAICDEADGPVFLYSWNLHRLG